MNLQQFLQEQVDTLGRVGKGYMADKPGTYLEGPESFGEALAYSPTPIMAGSVGAKAFGRALRGAKKYVPMHAMDIQDVSPALERYLTQDDPAYYIMGQRASDEKLIKDLAGHYIGKDILQMLKNKPEDIALELRNRVMQDRTEIPR